MNIEGLDMAEILAAKRDATKPDYLPNGDVDVQLVRRRVGRMPPEQRQKLVDSIVSAPEDERSAHMQEVLLAVKRVALQEALVEKIEAEVELNQYVLGNYSYPLDRLGLLNDKEVLIVTLPLPYRAVVHGVYYKSDGLHIGVMCPRTARDATDLTYKHEFLLWPEGVSWAADKEALGGENAVFQHIGTVQAQPLSKPVAVYRFSEEEH